MKFIEFFEHIYVINLPYRRDRRRLIEQELERAGMPFTPGKVELFPGIRPDSAGEFESIGVRGAFLSHLHLLKQAQKEQFRRVLVIEDDLKLFDGFKQSEALLTEQLSQQQWDIVHFGYEPPVSRSPGYPSDLTLRPFSGELIGLHFYGVNQRAFAPLIHFLERMLQRPAGHPEGSPISVDGALNTFCNQNTGITRLVCMPRLGEQRSSRSDISAKWFDRVPVLSELVNAARNAGLVTQVKQLAGRK
jgi:glycosyl transferase, family 25